MQIRELEDKEMSCVNGGGITSALLNAVTSAVETIYEFGRQFGSSIRRIIEGNYCPLR